MLSISLDISSHRRFISYIRHLSTLYGWWKEREANIRTRDMRQWNGVSSEAGTSVEFEFVVCALFLSFALLWLHFVFNFCFVSLTLKAHSLIYYSLICLYLIIFIFFCVHFPLIIFNAFRVFYISIIFNAHTTIINWESSDPRMFIYDIWIDEKKFHCFQILIVSNSLSRRWNEMKKFRHWFALPPRDSINNYSMLFSAARCLLCWPSLLYVSHTTSIYDENNATEIRDIFLISLMPRWFILNTESHYLVSLRYVFLSCET